MEKNRFNLRALLLASLVILSSPIYARSYKIELLIFAQDMPTNEVFNHYQSQIEWPGRVVGMDQYHHVSAVHMSLTGIKNKLQNSAGYRSLLHIAWTQDVGPHRVGTAVQIQDPSGRVNGYFRIQRGHYLHMISDLEYSPNGSVIYRLNEKRRFKLNQIHYLDHPKFGIIARVSPI